MMKRTAGFIASLCALFLLAMTSPLYAETVTASVLLTPETEVPPPTPLPTGLSGSLVLTINVTRDPSGNIINGTASFLIAINHPEIITINGFHIHEGAINANGPIRVDAALSGLTLSPGTPGAGKAVIGINNRSVDVEVLQRLLANPAGFYANLHTSIYPDGAIRGQFHKLTETVANTVTLSPANEVPPVTNVTAGGTATVTINPTRDSNGKIIGGNVTFSMIYDMPANSEITGLHIHKAITGMNGPIVLDSGISSSNSINLPTGKGTLTLTVPANNSSGVDALKELLNDAAGFYVNLHTRTHENGLMRGQLTSITSPPVIRLSDTAFLTTNDIMSARVELLVTGFDSGSTLLINGQAVSANLFQSAFNAGRLNVDIPPQLRRNGGTLFMQVRNSQGLMSAPYVIVVAPPDKVNPDAVTTVDAAKFENIAAPESIAAAFGSKLASQAIPAPSLPLPTSLDGTTVYVNGIPAGLFFVSASQVNYLIPPVTLLGSAQVVVVAKDGIVSLGQIKVAPSIPAIFTRRADGTGAPAAVASADGQIFDIEVSNPDGTPALIEAGNFVALFGTGMRFASSATASAITISGTNVIPLFIGAQGQLEGLDQVNLQIPQSLAGSGDVDLVFTLDGGSSNTVKLRIR